MTNPELLKSGLHFVKGDATQPQIEEGVRIIAHVCNNRGGWGAGFSGALSKAYPAAELAYRALSFWRCGYSQIVPVDLTYRTWVANMICQDGFKSADNPTPLSYGSLNFCLLDLMHWLSSPLRAGAEGEKRVCDFSLHMPRIGCGLAGGDWDEVEHLIRNAQQVMFEPYPLAILPIVVYDL